MPRLAPLQLFLAALVVLLAGVAGAAWLAAQQPWLGLKLESAGAAGVRVVTVAEGSPAEGLLQPGDVIRAAGPADAELTSLAHYDPTVAPHVYPTFAEYRAYLRFQDHLAAAIREGPVRLRLADGGTRQLRAADGHPWHALGLDFWLLNLFGCLAAIIGLFVWVFRPGLDSARLLALSGLGFYVATWNNSVYTVRDLAMDAGLFDLVLRANSLSLHLMLAALMAFLAIYPRRLGRGGTGVRACFAGVALVQINEQLQLLDLPGHSFYGPILAYYLVGAVLGLQQWRRSSRDPLDRGAMRWVVLSVLLSTGAGLVAYFVPLFFTGQALVSTPVMVGLAVTLYIGFALGVLRYRLFDLERWWFDAWIWFFGGLAVVAVDAALVLLLGMDPGYALGLAVILAGWAYFPARQWLWRRMITGRRADTAQELAELIQYVCSTGSDPDAEQAWREALGTRLEPLQLQNAPADQPVEQVRLAENGARLDVPGVAGGPGLVLRFADQGRRLFSRRDVALVSTMQRMVSRIHGVRRAKEEAASTERRRIMRDLHDDVGGQLLSLILIAEDEERKQLARRALQSLREAINALDDDQHRPVADFLDDWLDAAAQRLAPSGARLLVEAGTSAVSEQPLTARQAINLRRVLDEALTNALKHASPGWVRLWLDEQDGGLQLVLEHDGVHERAVNAPADGAGRGLANMRTRIAELGGELTAEPRRRSEGAIFHVALRVPLGDGQD